MKKLSYVDKGFLMTATRERPMHVGGVSLYTLPECADEHDSCTAWRAMYATLMPFYPLGERLLLGRLGLAGNASWEPDPAMDMDYHVRHCALPKPGRCRELFSLATCGQNVDFGIIACRRSILRVQRIIDYMEDALVELEDAAGLSNTSGKSRARPARTTAANAKAKTKSKV